VVQHNGTASFVVRDEGRGWEERERAREGAERRLKSFVTAALC